METEGPVVPSLLFQPVMIPSSEENRKFALVLLGAGKRKPVGAEAVVTEPAGASRRSEHPAGQRPVRRQSPECPVLLLPE